MRRSSEISNAILTFPELSSNDKLQSELESIINNIVKEYILSWYYHISTDPVFPRLIGEMLSQSFLSVKQSWVKLNISDILLIDVLSLFKQHLDIYHVAKDQYASFPLHSLDSYFHAIKPHPALDKEPGYIREYAKRIANNCLNDENSNSQSVLLLTIDIIQFILATVIEQCSRPEMIYSVIESFLINKNDSKFSFLFPNILEMAKNVFKPASSEYYPDLMDIFDAIFKIRDPGDVANPFQVIWNIYNGLLEPIVHGLMGGYFDDLLKHFIHQLATPDLLSTLVQHLNQLLFHNQPTITTANKKEEEEEEYEFVPYGQLRRYLANLIVNELPTAFVKGLGGKSRVSILLDRNLLAVFASKQRNKHLIYGFMDILVNHIFTPRPKRVKSIKLTNSQMRIPDLKTHRQSYSTATASIVTGQSYQRDYNRKTPP